MRKLYLLPVVLLALLVPGTAQAAPGAAADGTFYAYDGVNYATPSCAWTGNDPDWSTCTPAGTMANRASSVRNNGFVGGRDEVNLYLNRNYAGSWFCVPVGTAIPSLPGFGQNLDNDVESHRWVVNCGDAS